MAVDIEEVRGSRKKVSGGEGRPKGRVRLLWPRDSAELKKVACGSATRVRGVKWLRVRDNLFVSDGQTLSETECHLMLRKKIVLSASCIFNIQT